LAADAIAEIADAVWDEDATGHQTGGTFGQAIGDPGADTTTMYAAVVTGAAGTHIAADIIAIKAETAAILDDTDDIGVAGAGLTAVTVAAIANNAITAASLAADAGAEIADAVWDEDATGHQTQGSFGQAIGDPVADTSSIHAYAAANYNYLDTVVVPTVNAIVADTNELQVDWVNGGRLDLLIDSIKAETASILTDTAEIGAAGAGLTAITSKTDNLPSDPADASVLAGLIGTVDTVVDAIKVTTDKLDDTLEDDAGTFRFTENALEEAPTGGSAPTAAQIADAVWEETLADHSGTTGSTAEALNAAGAAGDPWTTTLPGAYGAGSAGKIIGDNINATISSRASQTSLDTLDDIVDTEVGAIKTVVDAILVDTAEIGAAGAGLTAITSKTDNLPSDPADASVVAGLIAAVETKVDTVDTVVDAIKLKSDLIPGTQDGKTFAEHVMLQSAALAGKASGLETTQAVFRSLDDAHDRITATVDEYGNRSAATYDVSSP
jgi:hypothetical protein